MHSRAWLHDLVQMEAQTTGAMMINKWSFIHHKAESLPDAEAGEGEFQDISSNGLISV